ncbi:MULTISPECIES: TonB-dependent receptor [Dyella]|uniref:TonB-dependent receptor n=2 Tax=Dyella TaxID=231454 RepID=A0A4R0YT96_9GAMM|nr:MULTISPECIES: TonB-dependent receptor [Dyella]TBR39827.1 TonB-dependent receptor [Dyella terrae]TCI12593.1 TonB-dependent receptor [Dyella soli]
MSKHELLRQSRLSLLIALGLASGGLHAQSTTASIVGQVPAGMGDTVTLQSDSGLQREVAVDGRGRYVASQLPIGNYTVTLKNHGQVVQTRDNVALRVGVATDVSFGGAPANAQNLSGVQVTANALPAIDVTSVDSRTVITSEQLERLPLGFSAEAIARLAPGAVNNGGGFTSPTGGSLVSFGGSGANENAYYINGFNTTDPLKSEGGLTLPYGSIEQQEAYTGGYSAQYGRSDGGVINMVGKRGTNEWHFGGMASWEPAALRSSAKNFYYQNGQPNPPLPTGTLYSLRSKNDYWITTYDAYIGGPIIKDKLFFFASAEMQRQQGSSMGAVTSTSPLQKYTYDMPKWYAKVDWNINDSNIIELTGASNKRSYQADLYRYNYQNNTTGVQTGSADSTKNGGDLWTGKYTGYLTDNLTVTAQYGKMQTQAFQQPVGYDPNLTYVTGVTAQNPAIVGSQPRFNSQNTSSLYDPGRGNTTTNLRLALEYKLGDHTLTAGIDNLVAEALKQGKVTSGPGYSWTYYHSDHPTSPVDPGLGVGPTADYANGATGYYVTRNVNSQLANVKTVEHAQYIEDNWQVNDKLLLQLGIRNDQFTNYNADAQPYIKQTAQWAPRLGFAWDVNGDSSFKVFGNVGRYYLASPLEPALSAAGSQTSTTQYFTYSGINADGTPTGLTQMSPPVSANNNFGVLPDPKTVTAKDIKSMYQDEYILGFTKMLNSDWLYGAKATRRLLRSAIDDFCDVDLITAKAQALGYNVSSLNSCYLINAGRANTFVVVDDAGQHHDVKLSREELGFPDAKRKYYELELFMEHPFNGTWYGKIDYVFSRSYGNTEGWTQTNVQSDGPSESADWDNAPIMVYSNGDQGNDHRHQLKMWGYYQITPEWLVSGNISLISGAPKTCLGLFPGDNPDPAGYGSSYHFCNGVPVTPGSIGRLPWQRQVDLGVKYTPSFARQHLGLHLDVFNAFNNQVVVNMTPSLYARPDGTANPLYGTPRVMQSPRYVRFSVTYDY